MVKKLLATIATIFLCYIPIYSFAAKWQAGDEVGVQVFCLEEDDARKVMDLVKTEWDPQKFLAIESCFISDPIPAVLEKKLQSFVDFNKDKVSLWRASVATGEKERATIYMFMGDDTAPGVDV